MPLGNTHEEDVAETEGEIKPPYSFDVSWKDICKYLPSQLTADGYCSSDFDFDMGKSWPLALTVTTIGIADIDGTTPTMFCKVCSAVRPLEPFTVDRVSRPSIPIHHISKL